MISAVVLLLLNLISWWRNVYSMTCFTNYMVFWLVSPWSRQHKNLKVVGKKILKMLRIYALSLFKKHFPKGKRGQEFSFALVALWPMGKSQLEVLGCRMTLHCLLSACYGEENWFFFFWPRRWQKNIPSKLWDVHSKSATHHHLYFFLLLRPKEALVLSILTETVGRDLPGIKFWHESAGRESAVIHSKISSFILFFLQPAAERVSS